MNRCSITHPVIYRSFKPSDIKPLSAILQNAWLKDDPLSETDAQLLGQAYLETALAKADYVQVAELNGTAVGIVIAKDLRKHTQNWNYQMSAAVHAFSTCRNEGSLDDVKDFFESEKMDGDMLKKTHQKFDACILLLAVNQAYKGNGIGGTLYHHFLDYLEVSGMKTFYLFTDSYCDYSFYEHLGLVCISRHSFLWRTTTGAEHSEFYLYANSFRMTGNPA